MAEIKLPAMSPTMEDGTLAKWLVKVGDTVKPGDVIAEIETDKATMELEADDGGVVQSLHVEAGAEGVKVGTVIAVIAGEDEEPIAEKIEAKESVGKSAAKTAEKPEPLKGHGEEKAEATTEDSPVIAAKAHEPPAPTGPTKRQTVREALRDAMAEEMRTDPLVFVMGEEVAEYQGAYKVTQGLLEEFGGTRVVDTPITEIGFAGLGAGAAMGGLKPIVEFMTFNFAMQAVYERRADALPGGVSRAERGGEPCGGAA
jgi:pyruvate dehydrogenase E1 component beta subunit